MVCRGSSAWESTRLERLFEGEAEDRVVAGSNLALGTTPLFQHKLTTLFYCVRTVSYRNRWYLTEASVDFFDFCLWGTTNWTIFRNLAVSNVAAGCTHEIAGSSFGDQTVKSP